jgi:inosose dehydratase
VTKNLQGASAPAMRVGNAPCSWGTLEFEGAKADNVGYSQMLDELSETGYTGTELGDWGYMPTESTALKGELSKRGVAMLGAFVPVALKNESAHESGVTAAVRTAKLIASVASDEKPFLVLADNNGTVAERTHNAGRITANMGLSIAEWKTFTAGANRIAQAVHTATGLRTVFHHHCAGYVETPDEIARFLELTNPDTIGLVFDSGHYVFGAQDFDAVRGLERFGDRVWYVHLKDCQPDIAHQSRAHGWDYFESLRHGIFCELGNGGVDFPSMLRWLAAHKYDGFMLVEQDVLPGMGLPKESARRNREYLRSIERCFA